MARRCVLAVLGCSLGGASRPTFTNVHDYHTMKMLMASTSTNSSMQVPGVSSDTLQDAIQDHMQGSGPMEVILSDPTLFLAIFVCLAIIVGMFVNQVLRTLMCTGGLVKSSFKDWVWPACVLGALSAHSTWLYNVVLVQNFGHSQDYAVAILMGMAVGWWFLTYLYEVCYKMTPTCKDEEIFTAGDAFSDLTEDMFHVTVRFMMQASLLCILIHVAQDAVLSGAPKDVSDMRMAINFLIAILLEVYLFVACKDHTAWEDLRRLRPVVNVQFVGKDATGEEDEDLVRIAPGDYNVRFAMSVIVTGIFHKFLVLTYPLLVFTTFARNEWVTLLKDILAITVVVSLDTLARPKTFMVFHEDRAREQVEEAAAEAEEAAAEAEQED